MSYLNGLEQKQRWKQGPLAAFCGKSKRTGKDEVIQEGHKEEKMWEIL
jgi:hypothetical protein